MEKIQKIASGTYGIVYKAKMSKKDKTEVAVKRNVIDSDISFSGSIRELDLLTKLRGSPFIVKLLSVSFGNPFTTPNSPLVDRKGYGYKEDYLHFIFEQADKNLHNLIYEKHVHVSYLKLAMVQILLGIEYMHSKGIMHRDIKPANLLWFVENGRPTVKLCDFGLSKVKSFQEPSSPGLVTCWYRAPEICLAKEDYSFVSDIWSIGCVFYEMVAKNALLLGSKDEQTKLISKIASIMPYMSEADLKWLTNNDKIKLQYNVKVILKHKSEIIKNVPSVIKKDINNNTISLFFYQDFKEYYVVGKIDKNTLKIEEFLDNNKQTISPNLLKFPLELYPCRKSWKEQINLSANGIEEFIKYPSPDSLASYENFLDLLEGLLILTPEKRFTASQALAHPFFKPYENIIQWSRENFSPVNNVDVLVKIIDCKERRWASKLAFTVFNSRQDLPWYKHRIIFQSLDLYDRYLDYLATEIKEKRSKEKTESDFSGKMMNRYEAQLRYIICLYIAIKYFSTLVIPISFEELCSEEYKTPKALIEAEEFEKLMLKEVLGFKVFRETLYEIADLYKKKYTELEIRDLLLAYGTVGSKEISLVDFYKEVSVK